MSQKKHFIAHPAREVEIQSFSDFVGREKQTLRRQRGVEYVTIYWHGFPVALMVWERKRKTRFYFHGHVVVSRFHIIHCGIKWKQYVRRLRSG